jgi:HEAT repeat protein
MRALCSILLLSLVLPTATVAHDALDPDRIPDLVEDLTAHDPQIRGAAAEQLRDFGPEAKPAVRALVAMLDDRNTYKHRFSILPVHLYDAAFRALIAIGSESVADLCGALHDSSPDVCSRAAQALGHIGPKARQALPILRKLCADSKKSVRWSVVQSLGQIGPNDQESLQVLLARLRGDEPSIREVAAVALGEFKPPGRLAIMGLVERLADPDPAVRGRAVESLGKLASLPETVVPALIAALRDHETYQDCGMSANCFFCNERVVAADAAAALAEFGECAERAGPEVLALLVDRSQDRSLRYQCGQVVGRLKRYGVPLVPRLVEALEQQELAWREKLQIVAALRAMGPHARVAVPALRLIRDRKPDQDDFDGELPIEAACALVMIDFANNPKAWQIVLDELEKFQEALIAPNEDEAEVDDPRADDATDKAYEPDDMESATSESDPAPRMLQLTSLEFYPNSDVVFETIAALGPQAKAAVPALQKLVVRGDCDKRIIVALGSIGAAATPALPAILKHGWRSWDRDCVVSALVEIGRASIPDLVCALQDSDHADPVEILALIGELGSSAEQAIPEVVRLMRDGNREVRATAAHALGRIHRQPASMVPELRTALSDRWSIVREQSALSLGKCKAGAGSAVPDLVAALQDDFIDVRAAAAYALNEIGPAAKQIVPALKKALNDPSPLVQRAAEQALAGLPVAAQPASIDTFAPP